MTEMIKSIYYSGNVEVTAIAAKRAMTSSNNPDTERPIEGGQATCMLDILVLIDQSTQGAMIDELVALAESNEAEVRYLLDIAFREFDVRIRQSHDGVFSLLDWGLLNKVAVLRKHGQVVERYVGASRRSPPRK